MLSRLYSITECFLHRKKGCSWSFGHISERFLVCSKKRVEKRLWILKKYSLMKKGEKNWTAHITDQKLIRSAKKYDVTLNALCTHKKVVFSIHIYRKTIKTSFEYQHWQMKKMKIKKNTIFLSLLGFLFLKSQKDTKQIVRELKLGFELV